MQEGLYYIITCALHKEGKSISPNRALSFRVIVSLNGNVRQRTQKFR